MKEEIVSGLRNALERGESIEQASQTFINAGYNPFEVRAATQMISGYGSALNMTNQESLEISSETTQKNKSKNRLILIFGILISGLIVLGAIGFLVYTILSK